MLSSVARSACVAVALSFAALGPAFADGPVTAAVIGEADTLDPFISTQDLVATETQHMYETLYVFDASSRPQPLLAAAMPKISDDGLSYTIPLRQDVKFHNGTPMAASDVVASLSHWLKVSPRTAALRGTVESISAVDAATVLVKLKKRYSPLISLLSFNSGGAAITPASNIGPSGAIAPLGTGPYRFVEHRPDKYLRLERFAGYVSPAGETSLGAGARNQKATEIRFVPVTDGNTRLEGLLSGQFDFAEGLNNESLERLKGSKTAEPALLEDAIWPMIVFNHKQGLMANRNLRKAVQASLNDEDLLIAAVGDPAFYTVDGALFPKGHLFHNSAGLENFNVNDAAKAAKFLKAGNYDATPLRILTSHQYEFHFKIAEVMKAYLEAAGFKVKLDVVDYATLGQKRDVPSEWDIYISHSPFLPEPALVALYYKDNRIGWTSPEKEKALEEFSTEIDIAKRQEIFTRIQRYALEDVPFIKVGNIKALNGKKKTLVGLPNSFWPILWNAENKM